MSTVCSRCGREALDTPASGLVCDASCSAQRVGRGPWGAEPARTEPVR